MNTAIRTGIGPQPHRTLWNPVRALAQTLWCHALCASAMVLAVVMGVPAQAADDGATLAALQLAYAREMNACVQRLAYAAAAEHEGHCGIAGLFRASATAESIHADRIAAAIEQLDARPSWTLAPVEVAGTAENLEACLQRETDERDRIYPFLARVAREECVYEACAVLEDVRTAGGTQVALFEAAQDRLDREESPAVIAMATSQGVGVVPVEDCDVTYSLCPGDGSLYTTPIAGRCPNCGTRGSCALVLVSESSSRLGAMLDGAAAVAAR